MKTLHPHPFPNFSPCDSRVQSKTALQKCTYKQISQQKTPPNQKSHLAEQSDFVQRVSKKYLYFHESPTKNQQSPKETISFPYTALNLCYFEKNFIDIKQKKLQKRSYLNSNQQIRSFLNTRLKTQPAKSRQISPEKEIFIGKRIQQKRISTELNLKNKIFFSVEKYQLSKNHSTSNKSTKQQKLPQVLKIKSKKAYFMGLYKGLDKRLNKQHLQSTIDVQKTPQPEKADSQQEENPFELKFRSRTQDNISMVKAIREEIRASLKVRDRKRLNKYRKEEIFKPWEVDWEGQQVQDLRELNPYQKNF